MLVSGPWTSTSTLTGADHSFWPPGVRSQADDARVAAYADALAFYHGDQWAERRRSKESRLVLNYARALVRKTASYVFPGPVGFSAAAPGDDATLAEAANLAERLLAELASELDLPRLDQSLAIDAAVLGDAAIKVTWNERRRRLRVSGRSGVAGGAVGSRRCA